MQHECDFRGLPRYFQHIVAHPFLFGDYLCVWFLVMSTVHIQSRVSGSQLTSTPSFAARRCRCTWSCSSSSWLGCQSRDRMRSMLRAYIVWEGITPWWTYSRQMLQRILNHMNFWWLNGDSWKQLRYVHFYQSHPSLGHTLGIILDRFRRDFKKFHALNYKVENWITFYCFTVCSWSCSPNLTTAAQCSHELYRFIWLVPHIKKVQN